jgi:hypothetical protein
MLPIKCYFYSKSISLGFTSGHWLIFAVESEFSGWISPELSAYITHNKIILFFEKLITEEVT